MKNKNKAGKSNVKSKLGVDQKNPMLYLIIAIVLLLLVTILFSTDNPLKDKIKVKHSQLTQQEQDMPTPQASDDSEMLKSLRTVMLLPENETPTVATILELEPLQQQNPLFYKDAQVGDKIVIFKDKAIIYREADKLIINVVPVTPVSEQKTVEVNDPTVIIKK